jgi:diguanylate cyclase (GGDEF)-like protein
MSVHALAWMQPRDRAEGTRTVLTLTAVAAAVTAFLAVWGSKQSGGWLVGVLIVLPTTGALVLGAWRLTRHTRESPVGWAAFPLIAVVGIVTLDLVTRDGSTAAQVFLFFPALYGASQLRRSGAVLVTAWSLCGDVVIALSMQPLHAALIDIVYVGAALVTTSGLLVVAGEQRAVLLETLQHHAAIDPLTGLSTRRVFDLATDSVLMAGQSLTGTALILLDVDHFKAVNDRHGHTVGDDVLVQLAQVLTGQARADDVVCRMGGDELALLLPGCSREAAYLRAEQICAAVRRHEFGTFHDVGMHLSLSAGVAHAPTDAVDPRSLYAAADAALYNAKRSGRDRVGALPPFSDPADEHAATPA